MFVDSDTLLSQEGMTQVDPLAMPIYALAIILCIPLINKLKGNSKPIWYADNAAAVGKLAELWDLLTREGPDFGCYPNPSNT